MEDINESIKSDQELDELSPGLSEGMCVQQPIKLTADRPEEIVPSGGTAHVASPVASSTYVCSLVRCESLTSSF